MSAMNFIILVSFAAFFFNTEAEKDDAKGFKTPNTTYYNPKKCGIPLNRVSRDKWHLRNPYFGVKVMGGSDAEPGEHPWAVAVLVLNRICCTGTLVSKKHVITAAHCFLVEGSSATVGKCSPYDAMTEEEAVQRIRIMYGGICLTNYGNDCELSANMQTIKIVRAQYGRFFRQHCIGGDLALLELEQEIDERRANYICLPNRVITPELTHRRLLALQAVGFGSNPLYRVAYMNHLQKINFFNLEDREICKTHWGENLPRDVICTTENYQRNVCTGDSGGGIMTRLADGRWVLLGVISFGSSCDNLMSRNTAALSQTYTNVKLYSADVDKFTGFLFPWQNI